MTDVKLTDLAWTGERYVTQIRGDIALEHLHRYAYASEYVEGKVVLDIASGEGYGSEMLSRTASHVYGVDIDQGAINHAKAKYNSKKLTFEVGTCTEIPLEGESVDVVVSFETIEHITDHEQMMSEVKRVLRPGGTLIISSPERHEYSEIHQHQNPFHLKELDEKEFLNLLKKHFNHTGYLAQRVIYGSALVERGKLGEAPKTYQFDQLPQQIEAEGGLPRPVYLIGVCSDSPVQIRSGGLCEQPIQHCDTVREYQQALGIKESIILERQDALTRQAESVSILSKEVMSRDALIHTLENKLKESDGIISEKDGIIIRQKGVTAEKIEIIANQQETLISQQSQISQQDHDLLHLKAYIILIKSSWSWKLTAPLRTLEKKFHKIFSLFQRYRIAANFLLSHRKSGIFDPKWYLETNPDVQKAGMNPWVHFAFFGIFEERAPHRAFSPHAYLKHNPDVSGAGFGAVDHYIRFGWKEAGRCISGGESVEETPQQSPFMQEVIAYVNHYREALEKLPQDKKTLLLVTHEMSRTGAPILLLNLAEKLRKDYTVIMLSLGGGTLLKEFEAFSDLFMGPFIEKMGTQEFLTEFLREISSIHPIDCALVNCIVSRLILRPLWENDIPSAHLIHEFASYTRPETMFMESSFFSTRQIYSSRLLYENALQSHPYLAHKPPLILPQGRCGPPISSEDPVHVVAERHRIDNLLRPKGSPENLFVVVGLGTVQLRKGVDLFLECAHRVLAKKSGVPIRFVWLGHGYNTELDGDYSVYLQDQIHRSGIGEMCVISHETDQLEHLYADADLLLLSSRLDPLPLVSQDMMAHGKPVVCFDKATGLAEHLREGGEESARCVVDFMDVDAAADVIVLYANDPSLYRRAGDEARALCEQVFNFADYTEKISQVVEDLMLCQEGEIEDREILEQASVIQSDFYSYRGGSPGKENFTKNYISHWKMGLHRQKPFPGFHPGIYEEHHSLAGRDPLANFIQSGKPQGAWLQRLITPHCDDTGFKSARAALHIHLYYTDKADQILGRISQCRTRPDLFISVKDQESAEAVQSLLRLYSLEAKRIAVVPNRGRDIGPFLTEFGKEIYDNYEFIGHLHTKKTLDISDRGLTEKWANFLYEHLLGGKTPMMDLIIASMITDPQLGLVYPDDPHVINWSANRQIAEEIAVQMGIDQKELPDQFNFPAGTMFWARTAALKKLIERNFHWEDYPEEPLPYDGSMLHAIERLLPLVIKSEGFTDAVTNIPEISR